MKNLLKLIVLLFYSISFAQVGIGTTNPTAELEITATSSGMPALELNPQTAPIGNATGQLSVIDNRLYLYDASRGKWLSVGSSTFNFGREGSLNNTVLEYAGDITSSGPSMAQNGTIVYAALNSSGGNPSKEITLSIYSSERVLVGTHNLQLEGGKLLITDFNINFSKGDYFIVRVNNDGGSNVNDVSMVLWTKWRK